MEKVIRIALQNQFGSNAENVLKLIMATNLPEIATEIALGIYEEPVISKQAKDRKDEINRTFKSFNPLTENVVYTYNRVKVKEGWALKDDDSDSILSTKYWSDDACKELGISEEELKDRFHRIVYETEVDLDRTYTSKMHLDKWERECNNSL